MEFKINLGASIENVRRATLHQMVGTPTTVSFHTGKQLIEQLDSIDVLSPESSLL